ncbi:MAG: preprotein translocase subunit SecG [Planctomycetota bacterium]|nr:preprotein translocase subunit SecG [Planctomycetota bacterium]
MQYLFMTLSLMTAIFLILLVLVQRGRGGGLTGALGGMGGQSAFGSKAGDLFTRITIGVAAFWIILSVTAIKVLNTPATVNSVFGDTDQTTFDERSVPSLTTDAPEDLSSETPSTSTNGPAAEGTESEAATESAAPAVTEEAAAPAEAPAASEPAAVELAAPESTEATPEKEAAEEKSE